jgi:hypothetical protein
MFSEPFIDIDEWRDKPVHHRLVHGGFKGTDTRFSFYFPPKEQYEGRFYQPVSAIAGDENFAELDTRSPIIGALVPIWRAKHTLIGFAAASGAYLVVTNNGSTHATGQSQDPNINTVIGYRAGAAAAQYSRVVAAQMYGPHRPYGYIYGGSGDMYAGLNDEEAAALREATRMGVPPGTWFAYEQLGYGPLAWLINVLVRSDPQYFEDFWKMPGYLGANPPDSLKGDRIQQKTTISKIIVSGEARKMGLTGALQLPPEAWTRDDVPAAIQVKEMPRGELKGATLMAKTGASAGNVFSVMSVAGDLMTLGLELEGYEALMGIKAGDEVQIDNSIYLAAQTYHRHQVPTPDYYVFDQFRGPDGKPLYPQRPRILGPDYARGNGGCAVHEGWIRYPAKVIMVETTLDEYAHPWSADWYRSRVKEKMGDRLDDVFRVWFVDNAMHGPPASQQQNTRLVEYTNVLEQALRDLSAWVEKGIAPPASTNYKMADGQVQLASSAAERKGVQPVVTLKTNGSARAEVTVGKPVTFVSEIEVPPNAGKVVGAEWDFEGEGTYPVPAQVEPDASGTRATVTATYAFKRAGTYFPALRAAAQRQPDGTSYAQIPNLARVRVVVN